MGGKVRGMRDRLLGEALRRLAAEAATRLTTLVASGDQIPFDVAEAAGPDDAFFHSYVPLTARYVREREDELRTLPAFEPAREAVVLADVAAPYLEARGERVPAEPGERAARLLNVFLAGLWDGSSEFSLDRDRGDRPGWPRERDFPVLRWRRKIETADRRGFDAPAPRHTSRKPGNCLVNERFARILLFCGCHEVDDIGKVSYLR